MERKIKKYKVLLFYLFLFNCCISILMANIFIKLETYYGNRGGYSWRTVEINIPFEKLREIEFLDVEKMEGNYYFYKNCSEENIDVKGVLLSDSRCFTFSSGSFEKINEQGNDDRIAVIGSHVRKKNSIGKDEDYIFMQGERFTIVGELDEKQNEWFKDSVIIPIKTAIEIYGIEGQYYVDGRRDNMDSVVEEAKWAEVTPALSLKTFLKANNEIFHIYLILFVLCLMLLIISIDFFTLKLMSEYRIYNILGVSQKKVICEKSKLYFKLTVLSNVISCIIMYLCIKKYSIESSGALGIIIAFVIDMMVLLFNTIAKIIKIRKENWK